ncbi:MAG: SurA N-terminal domain-containing protein [Bacterioplanes sp.]|nr:SurA N-terminal domain-containing protein [Bacterioplanes sp.]
MLQTIRDNAQGTIAKVIVFFIIVVFALWGVESIVSIGSGEKPEAVVGGKEINEIDIVRVMEQQKENLRRQFGEQYDDTLFNETFLRESAIEQLIEQRIAAVGADKLGLYASTQSVDETIVGIPAFQVEGRFSREQFQNILRMNGWSPLSFRASLEEDIKVNQARAGFILSNIETPKNVQLTEALMNEQRRFRYVEIDRALLENDITLSQADIEQFYADNQQRFRTSEKVAINYVMINRQALLERQIVEEDELQEAYQDYVASANDKEQRASSHILIEWAERTEQEALALARSLQTRAQAGEDFAELAKTYSDDIGTRNNGGSLGLTIRGSFMAEYDQTLYELAAVGDVSAPVKTDFGYHVIRLDRVVAPEVRSFAEARAELERDIRAAKAEFSYALELQELANMAFSARSINDVATGLNLPLQTTALFDREQGDGVAQHMRVRQAAFAQDVLLDREISAVVETDDGALVMALAEYEPVGVKTLAEVESLIVAQLTRERATSLSAEHAQAIIVGDKADVQWTEVTTRYRENAKAPRVIQQKAFAIAVNQPVQVATTRGIAVVVTDAIDMPEWQSQEVSQDAVEMGRAQWSRLDMQSYQDWVRNHTKIERR